MGGSDRESILGAIPLSPPSELPEMRYEAKGSGQRDLWGVFEECLVSLGGRIACLDEVEALSGPYYVEPNVETLGKFGPRGDNVWECPVGITRGDLAIAQTGTVIVSAGQGRSRLASLAPPHHVVLIDRSAIVESLEEAFARISERTSVLITGTSRTADIEGVLVRGVHGPRELWVVPLGP